MTSIAMIVGQRSIRARRRIIVAGKGDEEQVKVTKLRTELEEAEQAKKDVLAKQDT